MMLLKSFAVVLASLSLLGQCAIAATSSYSAVSFSCDATCQTEQKAALQLLYAATGVRPIY